MATCPPGSKCNYDPSINLYYGQCLPKPNKKTGSGAGSDDNSCTPDLITKCCGGSSPSNWLTNL